MVETQLNPHNELKITVYNAIAQRILDTPLIIRNAMLAHLPEQRSQSRLRSWCYPQKTIK